MTAHGKTHAASRSARVREILLDIDNTLSDADIARECKVSRELVRLQRERLGLPKSYGLKRRALEGYFASGEYKSDYHTARHLGIHPQYVRTVRIELGYKPYKKHS